MTSKQEVDGLELLKWIVFFPLSAACFFFVAFIGGYEFNMLIAGFTRHSHDLQSHLSRLFQYFFSVLIAIRLGCSLVPRRKAYVALVYFVLVTVWALVLPQSKLEEKLMLIGAGAAALLLELWFDYRKKHAQTTAATSSSPLFEQSRIRLKRALDKGLTYKRSPFIGLLLTAIATVLISFTLKAWPILILFFAVIVHSSGISKASKDLSTAWEIMNICALFASFFMLIMGFLLASA